jgi:glycosyltransferase involved in cell wall biosynthesis
MAENTIALCLIVKDEEDFLEACLSPLVDICSKIIIVDTGSSDRTREIAAHYTNEIYSVPFDRDFSAVRNSALQYVDTEWVLFLDADESFDAQQAAHLPVVVRNASADVLGYNVLRYDFFATGGWFSARRLKIFRNDPRIRYRNTINEDVSQAILEAGGRIENAPLILNHFGHCESLSRREAKSLFYLGLLQERLLNEPYAGLRHSYVALQLRNLRRYSEALEYGRRAIRLDPASVKVRTFLGHILRATGDILGARSVYLEAIALNTRPKDGSNGALWNLVGVMDLILHELDAAASCFQKALAVDPQLVHVLINQGLIAETKNEYSEALDLYHKAAEINPAFLRNDPKGRLEDDPYRSLRYETIPQYAGLGYHIGYCEWQRRGQTEDLPKYLG